MKYINELYERNSVLVNSKTFFILNLGVYCGTFVISQKENQTKRKKEKN
jgi:hypothetical protein